MIANGRPGRGYRSAQHEGGSTSAPTAAAADTAPRVDTANDMAQLLRERLQALGPERLELQDDGARHAGHAAAKAGGRHFSVLIVSQAFAGLSRVARHQMVMRQVADLMPHPLHALSIRALAPEEFSS